MKSNVASWARATVLFTGPLFCCIAIGAGCSAHTISPGGATDGGGVLDDGGVHYNIDIAGGGPADLHFDPDAYWAEDPPITYCYLDGGMFPPPKPPGGTPDCPDDKNREGCPCETEGMTASCWPGLRANRSLGVCMDGMTTCEKVGETELSWGPCMGYVLPVPGATSGKQACKCFSAGQWKIDNLSPCFYDFGGGAGSGGVASTILMNGVGQCVNPVNGMVPVPTLPWSTDTVTADCVGHFKLCFALKAGDAMNPMATDCQITQVCTEADYTTANMPQAFPPLPAFAATSAAAIACAEKFNSTGGYGEMSVTGLTVTCDQFARVFNRVTYCPLSCNDPNSTDPKCKMCGSGGSGNF